MTTSDQDVINQNAEIIVENEYVTVAYLPDKRIIYHTIHQPIPEQQLKEALNAGTEALRQYGACKWLSDDRKNGPLSAGLLEWGRKDWQPRTIATGWKYWANVVPQEMAAAGTLLPVISELGDRGLRMHVFVDLESAFGWLSLFEG